MRLAYHSAGTTLTAYALDVWLAAAKAAIGSVSSPGVLLALPDPKHPYAWATDVIADDRNTLAGLPWSRVQGTLRRGRLEFQTIPQASLAAWEAWHTATLGGRIPFVVELPHNAEAVAVTARIPRVAELTAYRRWQPASIEIVERAL